MRTKEQIALAKNSQAEINENAYVSLRTGVDRGLQKVLALKSAIETYEAKVEIVTAEFHEEIDTILSNFKNS